MTPHPGLKFPCIWAGHSDSPHTHPSSWAALLHTVFSPPVRIPVQKSGLLKACNWKGMQLKTHLESGLCRQTCKW